MRPDDPLLSRKAVLRLTAVFLLAGWTAVGVYVLRVYIPDHPVRVSTVERRDVITAFPQGWGFFTRDPREPVVLIHERRGDGWQEVDRGQASPANLFGAGRRTRQMGFELKRLRNQVARDHWVECEEEFETCLEEKSVEAVAVTNSVHDPILCGRLLVESRERVPWAWFEPDDEMTMPGYVILVDVQCTA